MKKSQHIKIKALLALASVAGLIPLQNAQAIDVLKADNTNLLNLPGSWFLGNVPMSGDVAVWDSTVTANRSQAIGGNLSWQGIRIANAGGTVMTISNTAASVLDIGSSGIDMSAASVDLGISAQLNLSAAQTWSIASGRRLVVNNAANTGSVALAINGPGTLAVGAVGSLGTNALTLGGGVTLSSDTGTARTISNDFVLASNISVARGASAGRLTINGNFNTGATQRTISIVNTAGSLVADYSLNLSGLASTWSGTGGVRFANGDTASTPVVSVRFGAAGTNPAMNTEITIASGVIGSISAANAAFNAQTRLNIEAGGTYSMSAGVTSGNNLSQTVQSLEGAVGSNFLGYAASSGGILTIDGGVLTSSKTFAGTFAETAAGFMGITKLGSTTQVLSGSNAYSGRTLVTGGTLLINGAHVTGTSGLAGTNGGWGSATNGNFLIQSGATLGGTGNIASTNSEANSNMILIQSGGTLAPGSGGIGTLELDGANISGAGAELLNMAAGAEFNFELAGNGGTPDRIDFWNYAGGDFLLNNNEINLSLSGPIVAGTYTVDIIRFFSDDGITPLASGIASGLVLGTIDPNLSGTPTIIYGTDVISIQYTTIPEPSAFLLLAAGGVATMVFRRRRA